MKERHKTVDGYQSPEGGPDISDHDLDILAATYASCRKNGGSKERCSKIAWGAVNKSRSSKKKEDASAISGGLVSSAIPASDRPEHNLGIVKVGVSSDLPRRKKKEESYKPFFHALTEDLVNNFSFDLTFILKDGRIYIKHNNDQAIPFTKLLLSKLFPELREMCGIVFDYIEQKYQSSSLMQKWKREGKQWEIILHSFLLRWFKKFNRGSLTIRITEDGRGRKEVEFVAEAEKESTGTENDLLYVPSWY